MVPPPGIAVAALRRERRGRSSDSACGIRPEGTETDGPTSKGVEPKAYGGAFGSPGRGSCR